jgi:hypothetical protein
VFPVLGIVVSLALLNDVTIFLLAGLLLGVVLYGVDVLVKSRVDRERPARAGLRRRDPRFPTLWGASSRRGVWAA